MDATLLTKAQQQWRESSRERQQNKVVLNTIEFDYIQLIYHLYEVRMHWK